MKQYLEITSEQAEQIGKIIAQTSITSAGDALRQALSFYLCAINCIQGEATAIFISANAGKTLYIFNYAGMKSAQEFEVQA